MRRWLLAILFSAVACVVGFLFWHATRPLVVDGYTDLTSYSPGDSIRVYLDARRERDTTVRLFDVSGRVVDSVFTRVFPQTISNPEPWRNGFGYRLTFTYRLPSLESGVYLWERKAPFVVRSRNAAPDMVVVYPANTIAAYNRDGGRSLYGPSRSHRLGLAFERLFSWRWDGLIPGHVEHRGTAVSFQRTGNLTDWDLIYPFLKWVKTLPYGIAFISDPDLDDYERIAGAQLLVIIGHSEYWTREARRNFDRFVEGGKPALVLSGNTMWWQVRYDSARTRIICYKEEALDPHPDPLLQTVNWSAGLLVYPIWPSIGAEFTRGGYGLGEDQGWNGYKIVAPRSPLLEGVALPEDSILSLPTREYDGARLAFTSDRPLLDRTALGFARAELIGYDYARRGPNETVGTFMAFQKSDSSGVVVNVGSMNWCSTTGIGGRDSTAIHRITSNAIHKLLHGESVFSTER